MGQNTRTDDDCAPEWSPRYAPATAANGAKFDSPERAVLGSIPAHDKTDPHARYGWNWGTLRAPPSRPRRLHRIVRATIPDERAPRVLRPADAHAGRTAENRF